MITGTVTEIQRFSVHDGPGIRTTVFLKGCPLHCTWCHNPECISFEEEEMYYPEKCIGCGKCAEGCYAGARVRVGKRMSIEDVMREVRLDRDYYGEKGGITVSGGEPQAQSEFTKAFLKACHAERIHTAIETCMYRFDRELLSLADYIMTDIKIYDPVLHLQHTGIEIGAVLQNIKAADRLGIPLLIRTPVIPGINDDSKGIAAIAAFVKELQNAVGYELLPYHPLGVSKAAALGREMPSFSVPSKQKMEELRRYADLSRQT